MKKTIISLLCVFIAFVASAYTVERVPNVHVADRTRYVSNPDGILNIEAQTQADTIISRIWRETSAEVVAVVVNEIEGADINTFATELFTNWGLGKKDNDNGLLVLIVKGQRKAVLRTGYGMEGVMPDAVASRIIRNDMAPHFKNEDYDAGTLAALTTISSVITDPAAAQELMSKYENDAIKTFDIDGDELFDFYIKISCYILLGLLIFYFVLLAMNKGKTAPERYDSLHTFKMVALAATVFGLGIPVLAFLLAWWSEHRVRNKRRICPNCKAKMSKLSEDEDNKYLNAAQDMEERLDSVDYDVWLCSKCGETDVLPFVKKNNGYTVCANCGARTCSMIANRIVMNATVTREGKGVKVYSCRNCHKATEKTYKIAKLDPPIAPVVGGIGGRGGGGGFSGGSFGGGFTGGGGASGGW